MSGSLIIFLVLSIALDFLAELGYKGPFCICFCNSTKMQKGRDLILPWRNQNAPFAAQYRLSLDLPLHISLKDFFYIWESTKKEVCTEGKGILRNCPLHERVKHV